MVNCSNTVFFPYSFAITLILEFIIPTSDDTIVYHTQGSTSYCRAYRNIPEILDKRFGTTRPIAVLMRINTLRWLDERRIPRVFNRGSVK